MALGQHLGRQRWAEVRVMCAHQLNGAVPHIIPDAIVRWPAASPVHKAAGAAQPIGFQQSVHLPRAQRLSTGIELSPNVGFENSLVGGWTRQADQPGW
jgi:hypothetical protein